MADIIRVLIADDHPIVRDGLRALLGGKPDMALVGEAADGEHAVALARDLRPDVIVMDLLMPGLSGQEAIQQIRREVPRARVLVLTSFAEDEQLYPALRAGVLGYLLKDSAPSELVEAIRCVHRGQASLHPAVARKLLLHHGSPPADEVPPAALSERELKVLKLMARGCSNQEIARELCIGEGTARFHAGNILSKLGLENRIQAVLYALRQGLVKL